MLPSDQQHIVPLETTGRLVAGIAIGVLGSLAAAAILFTFTPPSSIGDSRRRSEMEPCS